MTVAMKFCGITRPQDASFAAEIGAAYIGSIFTDSPRRVAPKDAARIWAAAPDPKKVGVFGDAPVEVILAAADESGLDVIQLHGGAAGGVLERLRAIFRGEIWSVIRIGDGAPTVAGDSSGADAVLVDSYSESGLGGTGRTFDWEREAATIRRLIGDKRLIAAGGLDPDNVAGAIHALNPDVVDVSSGVESFPGVKDHARMRAFAEAVAQADAE